MSRMKWIPSDPNQYEDGTIEAVYKTGPSFYVAPVRGGYKLVSFRWSTRRRGRQTLADMGVYRTQSDAKMAAEERRARSAAKPAAKAKHNPARYPKGPITAVRVQDTINDWKEIRYRRGDREDFHREVGKTLDQVLDSKKWGKVSSWPVRYAVSGMNADGEVVADNGGIGGVIRVFTEDAQINPATRSVEAAERLNLQALRKQRRLVDAAGKKAQAGKMSWADVDRVRAESGKAYEATRAELAASITNPASRKALAKYHGLVSAGRFEDAAKTYKRIHGGLKGAHTRAAKSAKRNPYDRSYAHLSRGARKEWDLGEAAGRIDGEAYARKRAADPRYPMQLAIAPDADDRHVSYCDGYEHGWNKASSGGARNKTRSR